MSESSRPRPRAAWAMLFLVAHAFVAGATHLHAADRLEARTLTPPGVSVGEHEPYRHEREAGEHVRCLLCRLQRHLVADLEGLRPVGFAPLVSSVLVRAHARPLYLDSTSLAPSGRAPPAAQA